MMKQVCVPMFLVLSLSLIALDAAASPDMPVFEELFAKYDVIRGALASDTLTGVADAANEMARTADMATHMHPGGKAGASVTEMRNTAPVLQRIGVEARAVAKAATLDDARAAFGKLSASLIDYRKARHVQSGVVVYCPMVKQSWLQRDQKIANPYYGASMQKWGEIVKD